jgi:cation diffusion facilitator CzcD-associated flavoprotein CzcO
VKNGIETVDGQVREVDIIVCATGFDMTNTPRWPTTGRNKTDLGQLIAERGYSAAYMSVAMADFPNYFMQTGPNFSVGNGNMIIVFERITDYFVKCIQKIQREGIKSMVVKQEAVEDFCEFTEAYFPRTVFAQSVSTYLLNYQPFTSLKRNTLANGSVLPGSRLERMVG